MSDKCQLCDKKAEWVYMPAYEGENPYYCNDCVPKGCSCNTREYEDYQEDFKDLVEGKHFKWIEKGAYFCFIDENGDEYPCCEFDYIKDGE